MFWCRRINVCVIGGNAAAVHPVIELIVECGVAAPVQRGARPSAALSGI